MKALLDTHTFLWWITDDSRLSSRVREIIVDGRNDLFFSVASGWEIAIKAGLGKVEVPDDLERFLTEQLVRNALQVLPVYLSHALHVCAVCRLITAIPSTDYWSPRLSWRGLPC